MTVRTQPLTDTPVETLTDTERRARILEAAALEIEVRGWARGRCQDEHGRVCAFGAMAHASGYGDYGHLAEMSWGPDALTSVDSPVGLMYAVPFFNDYVAESAADVTFLLRWRAQELRDLEGATP